MYYRLGWQRARRSAERNGVSPCPVDAAQAALTSPVYCPPCLAQGLGKPHDEKRSYLSLAATDTTDSKIDLPSTAMLDGEGQNKRRCQSFFPALCMPSTPWKFELGPRHASQWCNGIGQDAQARRPAAPARLALHSGVLADIGVSIPSKGEGLQRVVLTFPHFSSTLDYDPTTAFAGASRTPPSAAGPRACARHESGVK